MLFRVFPYPLSLSDRELVLRPLDDLASEMRVSRSFLELCFDAGCPRYGAKMSVAGVLVWLFEHYEEVRALAGLPPGKPMPSTPAMTVLRWRMLNAVMTLLEYGRSRASNWRQKRMLREALERVVRLSERVA